MCGRYTLAAAVEIVAAQFDLPHTPATLTPRYNIAPGQAVAVVRCADDGVRCLDSLQWGLVPTWAKDPAIGRRLINARAETLATKPSFRDALRRRRCLIPADGFYEWRRLAGRKQPYWVTRADGRPFGFAGLWERWRGAEGQMLESCTIVTTTANASLTAIHHRMPLIVYPQHYGRWLDPARRDARALLALLGDGDCETLIARPVSTAVNNPRRDAPELIAPQPPREMPSPG